MVVHIVLRPLQLSVVGALTRIKKQAFARIDDGRYTCEAASLCA